MTHSFHDCVYSPRYLYDLVLQGCINNSNFKPRAEKSVSFGSSTRWRYPHQRICTAKRSFLEFNLCMKSCRSAMERINWFVTDLWRLPGNKTCRHLDLFTMVGFSLNIKTFCLYVIWEKQDQIWANIFASPKIGTPVHLFVEWGGNAWNRVATPFLPHLFALDYIKIWLRSHRCVSDNQIRTSIQKSSVKQQDPLWKFL